MAAQSSPSFLHGNPPPFAETSSGWLPLDPNPSTPSPMAVITPAVCYSNSEEEKALIIQIQSLKGKCVFRTVRVINEG